MHFKGDSTYAVLTALAVDSPRPPATVNPQMPAVLSHLIMQLLEKVPSARPASAQFVANSLQSMAQSPFSAPILEPAPASRPTTRSGPPPVAPRRGRLGQVFAAAALVLIGFAAVALWRLSQPTSTLASGPTPPAAPPSATPAVVAGPGRLLVTRNQFHPKAGDPATCSSVRQAFSRARRGDHILLADQEYEERVLLDGTDDAIAKDLTLESANASGEPTVWRLPSASDENVPLLSLRNVVGLHLKGIVFEGERRADTLLVIDGACPGLVLEELQFHAFNRTALRLNDCPGEP